MKNRNRQFDYRQAPIQTAQWSITSNTPKTPTVQLIRVKQASINQQFVQIIAKSKKKMFNRILRGVRGRNNPIEYQQQFDFLQRWETINKQNSFYNINYEMPENIVGLIINFIFLIQKTIVVWFLSIYRLFQLTNIIWPLILGLIFTTFYLLWKAIYITKHYVNFRKQSNQNFNTKQELKSLFKLFSSEAYTLIYFLISVFSSDFRQGFLGIAIFDFLAASFQYAKGQKLYKKIKLFGIRSQHRNYMNLFDLISNLFIIFHFCAILIYSITLYSQSNWITLISSKTQQWYGRYIYSLYFTSTTMLTVGYGDITPTNKLQVLTVLMIQVLGTAINGYIFSEVGHTLAKIRQRKQTKQKDISDTEKLAKVYRLDNQLAKKMRQYIVNNEMENEQLNIQQQNNLLHKLNDQLRSEVNNYNHMQIVKENIFFLFYFSKKAQVQFAKRLQRKLFSPNQTIYQTLGKQKLFIVTKGRLQIYTDRKQGMRFYCKKKLKQIKKTQRKQQEISDNIFGYSTIIWGKPTNLTAVTKDFTVIYNLQKSDVIQVVHDDSNDYEAFCQLKEKIILQKYPQRWEVPRITSIRQHYAPSIFFLIKKQKSQQRRMVQKKRQEIIRSDTRCKRVYPTTIIDNPNHSEDDSQQSQPSYQNMIDIDQTTTKRICEDQRKQKYQKIKQHEDNSLASKSIILRSYKRKYFNNKKYEQKKRQQIIQKWQLSRENEGLNFQIFKNFNNFFKKRNLSQVIKKINNKDTIETQLTMVGQRMNLFHPRRRHLRNKTK